MDVIQQFFAPLGLGLGNLIIALIILVIGYIVARILASITRKLLRRTNLDNHLAETLSEPDERRDIKVEDVIAKVIFWVIMLFVLVAFFDRLGLTGIAAPITLFLQNLTSIYIPRLVAAGILLFVAWLCATALRFLVRKALRLIKLDERVSKYAALEEGERVSFGESLATAVYWFVLLLFLPSILNALGIPEIAEPVQDAFDVIIGYIPNVLSAAVLAGIGWFIARVIREVVINFLAAIGTDKLGQRLGLSEERSLSDMIGMLIYIFIWLVVIIAALAQLDIAVITVPTTMMLSTIIDAIPNLVGAALILIVAYAIAKLVADLLRDLLSGIGFDTIPDKLGLKWSTTTTPSQWVGYLTIVAIMLFAVTSAAEMLGSAYLVATIGLFVAFFWKVVLAVVIFAIGLYLANLTYRAVFNSGTNQANFMGRMAQIAIVVFAAAIALREIGIANEIVNLAFGILIAAVGLAIALSFGLGTTKIAERETDQFLTAFRSPQGIDENNQEQG